MDSNSQRKFLTTKEVAELLEVTRTTIYKYVHSNKLKPVYEDDWKIDDTMLFHEEDVQALAKEREKPGLTTGEVAKELGIHPVTVNNYINQGKLSATKQMYNGKMMNFIQGEELERLKNALDLKEQKKMKGFYSSKLKLYLFQTLLNEKTGEIARIMELDGEKGHIKTETGESFPLSEVNERGYIVREKFSDIKYITKKGTIGFRFKFPEHVASPVLDLIESFYRAVGYRNIGILLTGEYIYLDVKPFLFKELKGEEKRYLVNILEDNLLDGNVVIRHNGILLDSGYEPLTIHLPSRVKNKLKKHVKQQNTSLDEYINELIKTDLFQ